MKRRSNPAKVRCALHCGNAEKNNRFTRGSPRSETREKWTPRSLARGLFLSRGRFRAELLFSAQKMRGNEVDDEQRQNELSARLLEIAYKAEQVLPTDRVLCAQLGAAITYAIQRNPSAEVADLLRNAADRLANGVRPTVN
jgi:hypothetical protein